MTNYFYFLPYRRLGASEEVDDVAGGASGMGVDGIGEVGNRAGVYGTGFTEGSLGGIGQGARDRGWF